jgi:DNA-binding transcriptional ArsR family regulator
MRKKKIDIDRIFHALGDGARRGMLERLGYGPMSVSRLGEPMGMSLAAVVQHLQILEEAGLVKTEKVGRVRSCRIDVSGLDAAREWLSARRPEWDRAMDRLGDFLEETEE